MSALPLRTAGQVYVRLPDIPSPAILEVLGRAVVHFAQLEYQLIVAYRRATPGATLPAAIQERGGDTLGHLVKDLQKLAENGNAKLQAISAHLQRIGELAKIRNRYVHIGFARRTHDQAWVFLKFGTETSEAAMLKELHDVSAEVATLIAQLQQNIPKQ
ncbi:MAG TPA: hypothetical protein VF127_04645 [Nitrospira sp.]